MIKRTNPPSVSRPVSSPTAKTGQIRWVDPRSKESNESGFCSWKATLSEAIWKTTPIIETTTIKVIRSKNPPIRRIGFAINAGKLAFGFVKKALKPRRMPSTPRIKTVIMIVEILSKNSRNRFKALFLKTSNDCLKRSGIEEREVLVDSLILSVIVLFFEGLCNSIPERLIF